MNVNAPQPSPYKSSHERPQQESTGSPVAHRRRATLPSIVLSATEAATLTKHWEKGEADYVNHNDQPRIPSPLIGLAITSNTSAKRRSRSADALHEMAANQGLGDVRRRSAEIQYWRSTNHGIPETEEQEEDLRRSQSASINEVTEIIEPAFVSNSSTADISRQSNATSHTGSHHPEVEAPSSEVHSVEPVETQVEQPADTEVGAINRVDLRLSQIELNMAHLAHSMQALSERDTTRPFKLEKAPKGNARASSVDHTRSHGLPANPRDLLIARATSLKSPNSPKPRHQRPAPSNADLPTQQTLIEEPSTPIPPATAVPHDGNSPHATQTTAPPFPRSSHHQHSQSQVHRDATSTPQTIIHNFSTPYANNHTGGNAVASSTPQPQQQSQNSPTWLIDQLAPLYNALRYERGERKRLEAQVLQLQHDLLDLTTIIAQQLGIPPAAYPTPSPDALLMAHMMRGGAASSMGTVAGSVIGVKGSVGGSVVEEHGSSSVGGGGGGTGSAGGSLASADEMGEYGLGRRSPGEWAREAREARETGVRTGEDWQGEMF
jgi:hypothetical protein